MTVFKRFTKSSPCPVCQGARKDCRQNDSGLVFCRDGQSNPPDYILRGQDKNGIFNIWAFKPDCDQWEKGNSNKKREDYQRERALKRAIQEAKEKDKRAKWLEDEDKDKEIKKILDQLELSESDRARIKARGLSDEQIEAAGYRSIKQWQPLEGIDARLPGMNKRGNLNNPQDGILVPIRDYRGLFVGLRLNDPQTPDKKYTWLSSSTRGYEPKLKNGEPPLALYGHDKSAETIGISEGLEYKPYLASIRLNMPVLGAGGNMNAHGSPETLKASLASFPNLKRVTLFPDSGSGVNRNLILSIIALSKFIEGLGYEIAIADYGQLWVKEKGDKVLGDIDEIKDKILGKIDYITVNDFLIESLEVLEKDSPKEIFSTKLRRLGDNQKIDVLSEVLSYVPKYNLKAALAFINLAIYYNLSKAKIEEILSKWSPSNSEKNWSVASIINRAKNHKELKKISLELLFNIASFCGWIEDNLMKYIEKLEKIWLQSKAFSLDITFAPTPYKPYLSEGILEYFKKDTLLFIKSPTGTGKTTLLKLLARLFPDKHIFYINNRNRQGNQFTRETREDPDKSNWFYHIRKDFNNKENNLDTNKLFHYLENQPARLVLCIDSLHHIPLEMLNNSLLIFDEWDGTIPQGLGMREIDNLNRLEYALNNCDHAIFASGTLTDWSVNYVKKLLSPGVFKNGLNKEIIKIENKVKAKRPVIYWFEGSRAKGTNTKSIYNRLKKGDTTALEKRMLEDDNNLMIHTDSKHDAEAFYQMLIEKYKETDRKFLLITSSEYDPLVNEFLEDPNAFLTKYKNYTIICSPSIISGNDINIKGYFGGEYHFYCGVLNSDMIAQKVARVRDIAVPRYIWCDEFSRIKNNNQENNWKILNQNRLNNSLEEINLIFCESPDHKNNPSHIIENTFNMYLNESENVHNLCSSYLISIDNIEKRNYREFIKQRLALDGYEILPYEDKRYTFSDKEIRELKKEKKEEIKLKECADIINASDEFIGLEKSEYSNKKGISREQDNAIEKGLFLDKLPGFQLTDHWDPETLKLLRYDERWLLPGLINFYFCQNRAIANRLGVEKYINALERHHSGRLIASWKEKNNYLKQDYLISLKILDLITKENEDYYLDHPDIKEILRLSDSPSTKQILGTAPGKYPMRFIREAVRMSGCDIETYKKRINDKMINCFRINKIHETKLGKAILSALDKKYQAIFEKLNQARDEDNWVSGSCDYVPDHPQNIINNNTADLVHSSSNHSETFTGNNLEGVPDQPKNNISSKPGDLVHFYKPTDYGQWISVESNSQIPIGSFVLIKEKLALMVNKNKIIYPQKGTTPYYINPKEINFYWKADLTLNKA